MFIFLSPKEDRLRRMRDDCIDEPKWFAYPVVQAGFDVHFRNPGQSYRSQLSHLIKDSSDPISVLIFTIGKEETLTALEYYKKVKICSLFQWPPLEHLPFHKRLCYDIVLRRSDLILVYDKISEEYISSRYPRKTVLRIGLYIDTDFFTPCTQDSNVEQFLLCPGDHRRDENLVVEISQMLGIPIIRFSRSIQTLRFYESRHPNGVRLEYDVPFDRMKWLYQHASAIINVVNDIEIPAGITCFCEALAMNKPIVTSNGHSCAGYEFPDGVRPYRFVQRHDDVLQWTEQITSCVDAQIYPDGRSPRDLALLMCSKKSAVNAWCKIRELLTQ